MTDPAGLPYDPELAYDVGSYNALLSFKTGLALEAGDLDLSVAEVRDLLDRAMEFIRTDAAAGGRDLSEFISSAEKVAAEILAEETQS